MAPLPRRRVLQIPDSDEDDDNNDDTSVVAPAAATHSSSVPVPAPVAAAAAAAVPTEHLYPPPPLVFAAGNETCRAVHEVLARRGLVIKPTYLAVCLQELSTSQPGFANALLERQAELCFAHLLMADFNLVAAGSSLPPSFHLLHAIELPGPFILQVDEISDMGSPLRDRYQERVASAHRCLKLSMTDGVQRVFGIEYRPIALLKCFLPAGIKICLRNVHVKRGIFLLVPEVVEILGGFVQLLEAARQRAVQEINKPARSNRTRRGRTENQSLVQRATAAAWKTDHADATEATAAAVQANTSEQPTSVCVGTVFESGTYQGAGLRSMEGVPSVQHHAAVSGTEARVIVSAVQRTNASGEQTLVGTSGRQTLSIPSFQMKDLRMSVVEDAQRQSISQQWEHRASSQQSAPENISLSPMKMDSKLLIGSRRVSVINEAEPSDVLQRTVSIQPHPAAGDGIDTPMDLDSDEEDECNQGNVAAGAACSSTSVYSQLPFTYMALLKEKCSSKMGSGMFTSGTIKCVLTGVKDFQFKAGDEFRLIVYVDDGSLTSEVLIHNQVVQSMVGFSAKEVSNALASSNQQELQDMKNVMMEFQTFLKKFEGLMDVELRDTLTIPVVLKMTESANAIDANILLQRVSNSWSMQP
ncbi:hypothetical protein BDL97_04G077600 [Sphagnum fallax]|nr:hypothetical protein BDL97_04G077600 [Sphagnum fallax]KAH8964641.1 hypothetical protein BDL97_04G077600 [Sphagnum fallax]